MSDVSIEIQHPQMGSWRSVKNVGNDPHMIKRGMDEASRNYRGHRVRATHQGRVVDIY